MGTINDDNRTVVKIYGEDYIIKGSNPPEHVAKLAHMVDKQMCLIKEKNPKLSSSKVAIMAAMHIADKYIALEKEQQELLEMIEQEENGGD
ncbi:cell division protein ZapA [Proteinivorax hydrogeniformans]|uniref:Cell division protein ZapA n=1 Tax=Proteinivorax hydrogeniformans TaxID=1826727 RepID=A0AAU8HRA2_9FIRM